MSGWLPDGVESIEIPDTGVALGDDKPGDVHVMPTWGREHASSVHCWCGPWRCQEEHAVVVHRDEN